MTYVVTEPCFGCKYTDWQLRDGSSIRESSLPGEMTLDGVLVRARLIVRPSAAPAATAISEYRDDFIVLKPGANVYLGSDATCDVYPPDKRVAFQHCLFFRVSAKSPCWLVDLGSAEGTFVNQQPIVARRLRRGDLVQVGPFAWTFDSAHSELLPAPGLRGAKLELQDVGVDGRLQGINCCVPAGALVAVTGPSGGGKSTLIRAILEGIGHGHILADGIEIAQSRDWFRSIVG